VPTYQYKCKACENRFDVLQRITEDPLTDCPECGGEIRRVLFPAGVVFKGSGWYVTDYRSSSEKAKYESESNGAKADDAKKPEAKDAPGDSKAKESKPADKPTAQPSGAGSASSEAAASSPPAGEKAMAPSSSTGAA